MSASLCGLVWLMIIIEVVIVTSGLKNLNFAYFVGDV